MEGKFATNMKDEMEISKTEMDQSIGEQQKKFEEETSFKIDPKKPFIIRLDGHRFFFFSEFRSF